MRALLFLLIFQSVFAQESFVVVDLQSRQPLPFAIVRQGDNGFYTDLNGRFEKSQFSPIGTIAVSMMGYETLSIDPGELKDTLATEV